MTQGADCSSGPLTIHQLIHCWLTIRSNLGISVLLKDTSISSEIIKYATESYAHTADALVNLTVRCSVGEYAPNDSLDFLYGVY